MTMFSELLFQKKFLVTAHIEPPRGADVRVFRQDIAKMPVDALTVVDRPGSCLQLSTLGTALIVKNEKREPILEFSCTDRNTHALQADLIAASALGLNNVLCITGDSPKKCSDLDSIGLLKAVKLLNRGSAVDGFKLTGRTSIFPGSIVSIGRPGELARVRQKRLNGAEFFQTNPIFDDEALAAFLSDYEKKHDDSLRERTLATIFLLSSADQLAALKKAGALVPKKLEKRISSSSRELEEGASISLELLDKMKSMKLAGVHLVFDRNFGLFQRVIDSLRS